MSEPEILDSNARHERGCGQEARSLRRNFSLLTLYQVMMRTGWIFKTESIIMPAVLDVMGGNALLRGCLPMLNRFGQSLPPLLASDHIRQMRQKKWILAVCAGVMGFCFVSLSLAWQWDSFSPSGWLPTAFLGIYGIFFIFVGLHNLSMSLMYGKLIPVTQRGRLMLVSMTLGCGLAVFCSWFLLRGWLDQSTGRFELIFLFTGVAFLLSALLACLLKEEADVPTAETQKIRQVFRRSWATLRTDRNFRTLVMIAALFGMSMTLFPHYQALARGRLDVGLKAMVPWLIAQNIGAAGFSIPLGWLADRYGNRLVLQLQMLLLTFAPVFAIWFANISDGDQWFLLVFGLLGLSPVIMRTLSNYTLEIAEPEQQPSYLSTMSVCMAVPVIVTSSLVGLMVQRLGFEPAFYVVIAAVFIGWLLTLSLEEPRHSLSQKSPEADG